MNDGITNSMRDVILADRDSAPTMSDKLSAFGWCVFVLTGGDTVQSLFQAAKEVLPMDPPISGMVNWNALLDSLFGGVDALSTKCVAILWLDADALSIRDLESFSTAQMMLTDVADCLRKDRKALRTDACLRSFLLGKGIQFPPLKPADLRPIGN